MYLPSIVRAVHTVSNSIPPGVFGEHQPLQCRDCRLDPLQTIARSSNNVGYVQLCRTAGNPNAEHTASRREQSVETLHLDAGLIYTGLWLIVAKDAE